MAPKHAFLFDIPVRYVLGAGITTGVLWTFLRPKDVALAQEPEKKPKVLVRTASGAVISCNQTVGRGGAPGAAPRGISISVATNPPTRPRTSQIPPGLAGSEREMDYAKRMGMAK